MTKDEVTLKLINIGKNLEKNEAPGYLYEYIKWREAYMSLKKKHGKNFTKGLVGINYNKLRHMGLVAEALEKHFTVYFTHSVKIYQSNLYQIPKDNLINQIKILQQRQRIQRNIF